MVGVTLGTDVGGKEGTLVGLDEGVTVGIDEGRGLIYLNSRTTGHHSQESIMN